MTSRKIKEILPLETVGQKQTKKQVIVIEEVKDQYPQSVAVTFFWDKTDDLDRASVWDSVNVKYNINAKEYNWKRYNNINWWTIDIVKGNVQTTESEYSDNLPF